MPPSIRSVTVGTRISAVLTASIRAALVIGVSLSFSRVSNSSIIRVSIASGSLRVTTTSGFLRTMQLPPAKDRRGPMGSRTAGRPEACSVRRQGPGSKQVVEGTAVALTLRTRRQQWELRQNGGKWSAVAARRAVARGRDAGPVASRSSPGSSPGRVRRPVRAGGRSTGLPLPRFVSLAAARVNLRFGPGKEYPISWVLAREGLPVEIIAEFDTWRKVRLHDADEGWIHQSLLSGRRTIFVTDAVGELRRTPDDDARVVLRAEAGVVGELVDCAPEWCRIDIGGGTGGVGGGGVFGSPPPPRRGAGPRSKS